MIQIALYLVYTVALLLCSAQLVEGGLRWLGILPRLGAGDQGIMGTFADSLLLGLVFLTTLVSVVSLVQPITSNVQVVISLIVFICGGPLAIRAFRIACHAFVPFRHRPLMLVLALYIAWAVFIASGAVRVYDTGAYHVQAIRWLKEYGVTPGLANLFGQLGYNSGWHVFCSLLDHGPFDHGRSYHVAGLLVFVYFLAFCFEGCQRLAAGRNSLSVFLRILGFIAITYFYRDFIASLGTDMIAAVLVHYALVRASEVMEDQSLNGFRSCSNEHQRTLVLVTAVTVFAVTIKLSLLPCLLFPCLIWLRCRRKQVSLVLLCLGIALCLGLPFLARNYVLTGYLLYPQTQLDLFQCDWKVPADDVRVMTYHIREYAICEVKECDLAAMGVGTRLLTWLKTWGGHRPVKWLLAWAAAGLGSCLLIPLYRPRGHRQDLLGRGSMFGVIMVGVVFCFASAPEPRYLGGWGLAMGYFPMGWMASSLANRFITKTALCSSGAIAILFAYCLLLSTPGFLRSLIKANNDWSPRTTSSLVGPDFSGIRGGDQRSPDGLVKAGKRLLEIGWTLSNLPDVVLIKEQSAYGVVVNTPADNKLWNSPLPLNACTLGFK